MDENRIKEMVQMFLDDELDKKSEALLFAILSESEKHRSYFKGLSMLSIATRNSVEEFPEHLDSTILEKVAQREQKNPQSISFGNFKTWFRAAAIIILMALSSYLFIVNSNYQSRLDHTSQKLASQERLIQLVLNSLPPADVYSDQNIKKTTNSNL
ncbi:MAG: hypothetical protein K9I71_04210 [Ignavibacteriales bacterium]|nr:hypothetical protein [Ignavibacteriales bacterium]MCF8315301.1 hypothetical protein [Ignavibacteriales bacterium]MCF8436807.1 hypothetical protein [Ignavibacteriales bacterium]